MLHCCIAGQRQQHAARGFICWWDGAATGPNWLIAVGWLGSVACWQLSSGGAHGLPCRRPPCASCCCRRCRCNCIGMLLHIKIQPRWQSAAAKGADKRCGWWCHGWSRCFCRSCWRVSKWRWGCGSRSHCCACKWRCLDGRRPRNWPAALPNAQAAGTYA